MERAQGILNPRQFAEPGGKLRPVASLETFAEVAHPSSGLPQVVKLRSTGAQSLLQINRPGLVEKECR